MDKTLIALSSDSYVLWQKFKNVRIVTNACRWDLFVDKNVIRVVDLGGLDTKIVPLLLKIKKLQAKMLIFTTVHEIAVEDPLGQRSATFF